MARPISSSEAETDTRAPSMSDTSAKNDWKGKTVEIVPKGEGFELRRFGQPYVIQGAGGDHSLTVLKAAGGNSTRTWGPDLATLDQAAAAGITVTLGFWEMNEKAIRTFVEANKNHPALLLWALGNEMELRDNDTVGLWKRVNQLATLIHQLDPNHPVITVLAEAAKLSLLNRYAPDLDAVGINSYGATASLAARIPQAGWKRPYLITEFGPAGAWEVDKTEWGSTREPSSTVKAKQYLTGWQKTVQGQANCLGSYAFLWGEKREETHTWYGMFLPESVGGGMLEAVDAMTWVWTGAWPANRAPKMGAVPIALGSRENRKEASPSVFATNETVSAVVAVSDPERQPLTITWDVRKDGKFDNPADAPSPIPGSVVSSIDNTVVLKMPAVPGNYRVFAYAHDPNNSAATANVSIQVK